MNDEQLTKALSEIDELCAEHDNIVDQLATVTADRDIKAANLQLLVEKVLGYEDGMYYYQDVDQWINETVELARGLKQ